MNRVRATIKVSLTSSKLTPLSSAICYKWSFIDQETLCDSILFVQIQQFTTEVHGQWDYSHSRVACYEKTHIHTLNAAYFSLSSPSLDHNIFTIIRWLMRWFKCLFSLSLSLTQTHKHTHRLALQWRQRFRRAACAGVTSRFKWMLVWATSNGNDSHWCSLQLNDGHFWSTNREETQKMLFGRVPA